MGARRERKAGKKGVVVLIGRYVYRPIDAHASLFFMQMNLSELKAEYAQLRDRFKKVGWISQG
jgi:hypothetical protein